jgi:hypothetical protein
MDSRRELLTGYLRYVTLALGMLGLGLSFICCVAKAPSEPGTEKDISSVYVSEVKSLKPEECGRCHTRFYYLIITDGGKHRIDCRQCHVQFHIYRPGKVPYKEILPKCETCHEQVHGAELVQCTGCHSEVHTPMNIPPGPALEQGCYVCHPKVDREMKTYITRHTELDCCACHHTRHGYIPECIECHQPHTVGGITGIGCLTCHPPHKALQVVYPKDIRQESCVGCHRNAYEMLKQSDTKHTYLSCTKCHPERHRAIKRCRECHGEPHNAAMLQKYRICGQCHGVAHSLSQE